MKQLGRDLFNLENVPVWIMGFLIAAKTKGAIDWTWSMVIAHSFFLFFLSLAFALFLHVFNGEENDS